MKGSFNLFSLALVYGSHGGDAVTSLGFPLIFSSKISDVDIRQILNFAKKYEIIAFNEGIKLQKTKQNELLRADISKLKAVNNELGAENMRLAAIIEKLIPEV